MVDNHDGIEGKERGREREFQDQMRLHYCEENNVSIDLESVPRNEHKKALETGRAAYKILC